MITHADLSDESSKDRTPAQFRQPRKLSPQERATLRHCENTIHRALQTFVEAGDALKTIRNQRLYREQFSSFRAYCRARWGFEAARARQFIAAADVYRDVVDVTAMKPINENQMRPLVRLDTGARRLVWQKVTEHADYPPTDDAIKEVIRELVPMEPAARSLAVADMAALLEQLILEGRTMTQMILGWNFKAGLDSEQRADLHRALGRVQDAIRDVLGQLL
jgi:hypothetical protein